MERSLSPRLKACCSYVAQGDRVADIGCDHGYLGIWLLKQNIARSVIAADVRPQPLNSAVRNAEKYQVSDRMEFYLSDGAKNIPRDFDVLVCAGMGADTIVSILEAAPWLKSSRYRLILQCQSKVPMLRKYLSEGGWRIHKETVVRDGRFLYTVMKVLWEPGTKLSPGQLYFSPPLLEDPAEELPLYYRQVISKLRRAVSGQGENADPEAVAALRELAALADEAAFAFLKEE